MKETSPRKKNKNRDGKCEKWELSSESELPMWKFHNISLLSGFEISVIQYLDSISQKQVCWGFMSLHGLEGVHL